MMIFGGDTFLRTRNGADPFEKIQDFFSNKIVCLNIETALNGEQHRKKHINISSDENAFTKMPYNIKIVAIVNNHVADSGNPKDLAKLLKLQGRIVVGPENPSVTRTNIDKNSIDFFAVFLGIPRIGFSYNNSKSKALLKLLGNSDANLKIVMLHWGYEQTKVPAPFQKRYSRKLIDSGANIVIGHHPHVPQGYEVYNGKYIFYSLGNFNFWQLDGNVSENNCWGYMVDYKPENEMVNIIPYRINENYQPYRASKKEEEDCFLEIKRLCKFVEQIEDSKWFKEEYSSWFKREMKVWLKELSNQASIYLLFKWILWLLAPMQLKYYYYAIYFWIRRID